MQLDPEAIRIIDLWYADLDIYQDRLPAKGSIAAALHVLDRLQSNYTLDTAAHVAGGEAQITGLSAATIKRILARFGEARPLSAVGGRSNRGARGDVAKLLGAMRTLNLGLLPEARRDEVLTSMQRHLVVEYVPRFFAIKRVRATFDQNAATGYFIATILDNARATGKAGPVAEHLVGAKLALRFPDKEIRNKRFSTSDSQSGFSGDFEIGNTVFHVTVAPMPELLEKCKGNLEQGLRVYLLVPESHVVGARQNVNLLAAGRIAVEAIESFVGTNVDELSEFDGDRLKSGFRCLLEKYNSRVEAVELDRSLLIEIPPNLQ
jgi:hypothetical protein